jgi:hypothetical protein
VLHKGRKKTANRLEKSDLRMIVRDKATENSIMFRFLIVLHVNIGELTFIL